MQDGHDVACMVTGINDGICYGRMQDGHDMACRMGYDEATCRMGMTWHTRWGDVAYMACQLGGVTWQYAIGCA